MDEAIQRGGVEITWEPGPRLFRMRFSPLARPTADDARRVQAWIEERMADGTFLVLVDFANADASTLAWRYRWMGWAYHHRRRVRAASIRADGEGLGIVRMFARATEIKFRPFASEHEARAWLQQGSVPAEPI